MTRTLIVGALLALALPLTATAGPIENACSRSDRKASNRALCSCIQQVADITLESGDQRRAAKFFKDPDQAQQVRMSKSNNDNAFWARYKNFGDLAQTYCAG
jgi:hypothetical protein